MQKQVEEAINLLMRSFEKKFDDFHGLYLYGLFVDGKMTMRNIDGTNVHNLTASKAGHRGVLSRNGTYFYSIGDTEKGEGAQLQRFRMILR